MREFCSLDELVEINPDVSIPKGSDAPYVEMADVVPWQRFVETEKWRVYSGGGAKFAPGDTLFARISPSLENGKVAQYCARSDEAGHGSTEFIVMRARPDAADEAFVYYLATSEWVRAPAIKSMSGASGRQRVDPAALRACKVPLLEMEDQQRVAFVLSRFDLLIRNNLRRVALLEGLVRELYREWFVKYRFPGHEDIPLVVSPIGPIPDGWTVSTVGDAIELSPRVKLPRDKELRFVPMGFLVEGSMVINGYDTRGGPSGSQFRNGDTLLARITPSLENGKTGFVQFLPEDEIACGSTEFIVMRSRSLTPEFVYLLARTDDFRRVAIKSMVGASGRQRVQENSIALYTFAQPDSMTLKRFRDVSSPMFRMVQNLVDQNANLRATRDTLLPKLVSGEVDVTGLDIDAEWLAS